MPPPLAPPPAFWIEPLFQTVSPCSVVPETWRLVPPQARTQGLAAGKSTCALPSSSWSREPSSPEAAQIVTPSSAADWKTWLTAWIAWLVQMSCPSV